MRCFTRACAILFACLRIDGLRPEQRVRSQQAHERMKTWHQDGQLAHKGQGGPALPNEKYIFFERDMAGFNNIRLQLQSMVAIAAVTGRTLVLPAPNRPYLIDQYYEFDFFDAAPLMATVHVTLSRQPGDQTFVVDRPLSEVDVKHLPHDRDWLFPMMKSRIQHFECLQLSNTDKAVAAHAVLHGLVMDHHLEEMASSGLEQLGLVSDGEQSDFDCVHVRRGDFREVAPGHLVSDRALTAKFREMLSDRRPLLVLSDERPKLGLGRPVKYASEAYVHGVSSETRVAVDMIMCSRGKDFVGTGGSTFTTGIFELRQRRSVLQGGADVGMRVFDGDGKPYSAPHARRDNGLCWEKATTFNAIKLCNNPSGSSCF